MEQTEGAAPGRPAVAWMLSGCATTTWAIAVAASGVGDRVLASWESTVTMLFGSFVTGSSPVGGGAVAFPVFTKALDVPAPVARTFGLCTQAVGMTMASIAILVSGRAFHRRAVVVGGAAAVASFVVSIALSGRADELFWPPSVPAPWVKATFSIVLATTSFLMVRHLRHGDQRGVGAGVLEWNRRLDVGLVVVAALGGLLSSLTGTGANILVFLFLFVLVGVGAKQALPSAILVMTLVSIVGLVAVPAGIVALQRRRRSVFGTVPVLEVEALHSSASGLTAKGDGLR